MIYLICSIAIIAIIISFILIVMGIEERDKNFVCIGSFILVLVLGIGGCFYAGIKLPLVIVNLLIGLPMCYSACKIMAECSKNSPYTTGDKIIGTVYWSFSMIFLIIAFYYWYYIPEYQLLPIALSVIAMIACIYAVYLALYGKSNFLPNFTAIVFAGMVFYFGEIRDIIPLNRILYYIVLSIFAIIGLKFIVHFVYGINRLHEPEIHGKFLDRRAGLQALFSGNKMPISYHTKEFKGI